MQTFGALIGFLLGADLAAAGRSREHAARPFGKAWAGFALFRPKGDAPCADAVDILDADKAEDRAQIRFLEGIGLLQRSRRVEEAAARRGDDHPLAARKPFRAGFRLTKGSYGQ